MRPGASLCAASSLAVKASSAAAARAGAGSGYRTRLQSVVAPRCEPQHLGHGSHVSRVAGTGPAVRVEPPTVIAMSPQTAADRWLGGRRRHNDRRGTGRVAPQDGARGEIRGRSSRVCGVFRGRQERCEPGHRVDDARRALRRRAALARPDDRMSAQGGRVPSGRRLAVASIPTEPCRGRRRRRVGRGRVVRALDHSYRCRCAAAAGALHALHDGHTRAQPGLHEDKDIFGTLARNHGGHFGAWTAVGTGRTRTRGSRGTHRAPLVPVGRRHAAGRAEWTRLLFI
jgi:hypothetical protein